jgi:hypothetical protein
MVGYGPDSKGLLVLIVAWGAQIIATPFIALRVYSRVKRGVQLWWDDHLIILSWVRRPLSIRTTVIEETDADSP